MPEHGRPHRHRKPCGWCTGKFIPSQRDRGSSSLGLRAALRIGDITSTRARCGCGHDEPWLWTERAAEHAYKHRPEHPHRSKPHVPLSARGGSSLIMSLDEGCTGRAGAGERMRSPDMGDEPWERIGPWASGWRRTRPSQDCGGSGRARTCRRGALLWRDRQPA
jgi:hypothetical protein